jgi:hypothetical protein
VRANVTAVYTIHPRPDVDLACVNISSLIAPRDKGVFFKSLNDGLLADFADPHLLPGKEVWFVGYPDARFDTKHNLPILRRGYIASIPKIDFEGREQILIDAHVHPGSSGSPVFTLFGAHVKLLGVVTQTMISNQKVQPVPSVSGFGVAQTIGLGIVLKATLLKELFEAASKSFVQPVDEGRHGATSLTSDSAEDHKSDLPQQ